MNLKDYIIVGLLFAIILFSFRTCKEDNSFDIFKEILKREDVFRDSLQKQAVQISQLKETKQTVENNYYYQNEKVNKYLDKPLAITQKDSSNCMPIINSLFDCKDLLFGFQKSSLSLNRVNDSLIYALEENTKYKDEFLKLKDLKFDNKPRKERFYITASASLNKAGFEDFKLGGLLTTKGRFAYGYQYGTLNKSHEAKIGFSPFK